MVADNSYSRLVAWLKIILPLIALAILSSIFLVSRSIDPSDAIPYTEASIEERLRDPRLTEPTFAGMTSDGAAVSVEATSMRPVADGPGQGTAQRLTARFETPDGVTTTVDATDGRMDAGAQRLDLSGGVIVTTSTGYRITAPDMTGSLARTTLDATGQVLAEGPPGRIWADSMHLSEDPDTPGSYLLVFKDRVRLIYTPDR